MGRLNEVVLTGIVDEENRKLVRVSANGLDAKIPTVESNPLTGEIGFVAGGGGMSLSASKLRIRAAISNLSRNLEKAPILLGNMPSPPTVLAASSAGAATTTYHYSAGTNATLYKVAGGNTDLNAGTYLRFRGAPRDAVGTVSNEMCGTVSWVTDAPFMAIQIPNADNSLYRFLVDDRYVSIAGTSGGGTTPNYFTIDFASVRAFRKITVELQQDQSIRGVQLGATDTIYAPEPNNLRVTLVGDSYSTGTISDTAGVQRSFSGLPGALRDFLGADVYQSALGGTGYVNASTKITVAHPLRIAHVVESNPDVVLIPCGINDMGFSGIQAAALATLQGIRAGLPGVPIVVFGPWAATNNGSANQLVVENAIQAAVVQMADVRIVFVPTTQIAKPVLFGTGKQGTTNGTGNTDFFIGPDGTHPTLQGSLYLGRFMANAVVSALRNLFF